MTRFLFPVFLTMVWALAPARPATAGSTAPPSSHGDAHGAAHGNAASGPTVTAGPAADSIAAAPAGDAAVGTFVGDLLALRRVTLLDLKAGQVRQIIQPLSVLDRAEQDYQNRARVAGRPVMAQMRRVRAALLAGQTPDAADQEQVQAALAPLRPAEMALEKQRKETVGAIGAALTAKQLASLRAEISAAGVVDTSGQAVPPGPEEGQAPDQLQLQAALRARQAEMQALATQREAAQQHATEQTAQLQKEMDTLQQELQKLNPQNGQGDAANNPDDGDPARAAQHMAEQAQREADLAQHRAVLVQQIADRQVRMARVYAEFAAHQAALVRHMAQIQAEAMQMAAHPQLAAGQGAGAAAVQPVDDEAIRQVFLRPGVLTFLRARALEQGP